jgi:hypothetical protein
MDKVKKEKFIDAIRTDWEIDFIIREKDKFHFERACDSQKGIYYVELWDWRDENNPICIFKKEYKDKYGHENDVFSLVISSYNKKLVDLINLISIESETTSLDSAP